MNTLLPGSTLAGYLLVYRITFKDAGTPEYGLLHRGTKESCENAMELVPAVNYTGSRFVEHAELFIIPVTVQNPEAPE